MRIHLQREIEKLKRLTLALGAEVENDVVAAIRSVEDRDAALAEEVVGRERRTDEMEVDVEEECLKILALHQPVAGDLRYIIAILKINHDLERIGDLAAHIAERGLALVREPAVEVPAQLGEMAAKSEAMLRRVIDALIHLDPAPAHEVIAADAEIDEMNRAVHRGVRARVMEDPALFEAHLQIMHIARHLERIADHACNIAEDLIYMAEGRIVRHATSPSPGNAAGGRPA